MPDRITVTPEQIAAAIDRAARYRRSLVPPEWQGKPNLTELVTVQALAEPRYVSAGFWHVGNILDSFSERQTVLAVHWNPTTNQVKVQRPPTAPTRPDPKPWQPVDNPGIR